MNCLSETKIESYILFSVKLSEEEISHILNCDRCRDKYEFFKNFYDQLSSETILEPPFESHEKVIFLKPVKYHIATRDNNYKLAAQSENGQQKFIVFHFSNEDEEIIGRIMHEKETGLVSLHLLSENKEKISSQKIKILESGLEAITDDNGFASFGKQEEFICQGIIIESPLAVFDLKPLTSEQKSIEEKHIFKLKNKNLDEIQIEVNSNEVNRTYRISLANVKGASKHKELQVCILTNADRVLTKKVEKGISVFETENNERILKVHIY